MALLSKSPSKSKPAKPKGGGRGQARRGAGKAGRKAGRTSGRAGKGGGERASFFSARLKERLRRFSMQLLGLLWLALAAALIAALASHDPADPSLNTAPAAAPADGTATGTANWLSLPGSYASDLLIQAAGPVMAWLLPLGLTAWGLRCILRYGVGHGPLRLIVLVFAAILAAMALGEEAAGSSSLHGGWFGALAPGLEGWLSALVASLAGGSFAEQAWLAGPVLRAVLSVAAFVLAAWALTLSARALTAAALRASWRALFASVAAARALLRAVLGKPAPPPPEPKPARSRREGGKRTGLAGEALRRPFAALAARLGGWGSLVAGRKGLSEAERREPHLGGGTSTPLGLSGGAFGEPPADPLAGSLADPLAAGETSADTPGRAEPQLGEPGALGGRGAPSSSAPSSAEVITRHRPSGGAAPAKNARRQRSADFALPSLSFLNPTKHGDEGMDRETLARNTELLEKVLHEFGVQGSIVRTHAGPIVTRYELDPAPGIKTSRVISLADDIARSMSAVSARIAVVPGASTIGIELPNRKRDIVGLRELLSSEAYEAGGALPIALGVDIGGKPLIADLAKMPHLLIAGTTGSGKSVSLQAMLLSLLYRLPPEECKLIMVDPKMLELSVYDGIPHLITPVVTDPKKAIVALKWAVREMESRYRAMSRIGARNLTGYNERVEELSRNGGAGGHVQTGYDPETGRPVHETRDLPLTPLPYIVVVVDEMADLMMIAGKEVEGAVQRLAQMARAAGIHLIMATQRPSVDVITGTVKANFPTRISFHVTSKIDSRTILGEGGAEQLLGQGDMLHMAHGGRIARVHGPFVSEREVERVTGFLRRQGAPEYDESITREPEEGEEGEGELLAEAEGEGAGDLYAQAKRVVADSGKASTSYLQRRLGVGYNRAANLIERMEQEGFVSEPGPQGKREILGQA